VLGCRLFVKNTLYHLQKTGIFYRLLVYISFYE
jgi:hypothetical protein